MSKRATLREMRKTLVEHNICKENETSDFICVEHGYFKICFECEDFFENCCCEYNGNEVKGLL